MKTVQCDLCNATAEGETFDDWMQALMPHYKEAHSDVMNQHADDPKKGEEKKQKWMEENKARFDAA